MIEGELSFVKLPSTECHWTLLKISRHWFGEWLGAVRQQAITWASVDLDLCCHMTSLGHNEINHWSVKHFAWQNDFGFTCKLCAVNTVHNGNPYAEWAPADSIGPYGYQVHWEIQYICTMYMETRRKNICAANCTQNFNINSSTMKYQSNGGQFRLWQGCQK